MNGLSLKLLGYILILAVAVSTATYTTPVFGAGEEDASIGEVTDPGILPDSGFYFIKSWGRNLQLMFTNNNAEKAALTLRFANEDALALKKLCDMGKCDVSARYSEQYVSQLRQAIQATEQLQLQQGQENSEGYAAKLEQNYLRQQEILASVLEKASDSAQNGILNAIENSNKHVEAFILAHKGQAALEQYQQQVNQQTNNMGESIKIRVQQRLQAGHGQPDEQSNDNNGQTQQTTQTQTMQQTQQQTMQQTGQQDGQNQGTQQTGNQGSNMGGQQGNGTKKQGK